MSDFTRLRQWARRAAPARSDLIKALVMASIASWTSAALFVGALALLVVSAQRPGLRAIGVFLILLELVAFLRSPLRFAERMSTHRLGFSAVAHWREWLMATVAGWDFSRWQRYSAGDLLERALGDTEELQDLWLRGVIPSAASISTMIVSDVVITLLVPGGQWWPVAALVALTQGTAVAVAVSRFDARVAADRDVRRARAAFVATLVEARSAAPEIDLLGASDFLRRRNASHADTLSRAELTLGRAQRRDSLLAVAGALVTAGVVGAFSPHVAPVWVVVAGCTALTTFDALESLVVAQRVGVAVTAAAERLDDLGSPSSTSRAEWMPFTALILDQVALGDSDDGVRRVSAQIPSRSRVAVVGASGAGKSTLLRAIAGLDSPGEGTVRFDDRPVHDIVEENLRDHVSLVPSEPGLLRGFVRDVIGLGRPLDDGSLAQLAALGLPVAANDQWDELSRGERQRVALVRALARRSDVLLLDEPTSALGARETRAVLDVLSHFEGTLVIATHDPLVAAWCDQVIDVCAEQYS